MNERAAHTLAPETGEVTRRRPLLFLGAYLAAAVIVMARVLFPSYDQFAFILATLASAIAFLPWGFVMALEWTLNALGVETKLILFSGYSVAPANAWVSVLVVLSYAATLGLAAAGSLTERQRSFRLLFIVFIVLLLIDMGGCSLMK